MVRYKAVWDKNYRYWHIYRRNWCGLWFSIRDFFADEQNIEQYIKQDMKRVSRKKTKHYQAWPGGEAYVLETEI